MAERTRLELRDCRVRRCAVSPAEAGFEMRVVFLAPTTTEYSFFSGILAEATLGFIVVGVATILTVWIAARIFRVGILMYGKRPTLPEVLRWVRHS